MLEGSVASGEQIYWQRDHHEEQAELWHGAGDGPQQNAERGGRKKIDRSAQQKERNRAGDRHVQQTLDDDPQRQTRGDNDDQAVRPYFGEHNLSATEGKIPRRPAFGSWLNQMSTWFSHEDRWGKVNVDLGITRRELVDELRVL